jgi:hypothetical protein
LVTKDKNLSKEFGLNHNLGFSYCYVGRTLTKSIIDPCHEKYDKYKNLRPLTYQYSLVHKPFQMCAPF